MVEKESETWPLVSASELPEHGSGMQEAPRRTAQVEILRGALSGTLASIDEPRSNTHLDDIFAEQESVVEVAQRGGLFRPFDLAVRFGALSTQDD